MASCVFSCAWKNSYAIPPAQSLNENADVCTRAHGDMWTCPLRNVLSGRETSPLRPLGHLAEVDRRMPKSAQACRGPQSRRPHGRPASCRQGRRGRLDAFLASSVTGRETRPPLWFPKTGVGNLLTLDPRTLPLGAGMLGPRLDVVHRRRVTRCNPTERESHAS